MKRQHWSFTIVSACAFAMGSAAASSGADATSAFDTQRALMGDLNGDSIVDASDLQILLENYGATGDVSPMQGDMNGDGVIDKEDVRILLSKFGATVDDEAVLSMLAASGLLGATGTTGGSASNHHPIISNNQHSQEFSQSHPNHEQALSAGWPGWPDGHQGSTSNMWPPNHWGSFSQNWPGDHQGYVSSGWPPSHKAEWSPSWPPDGPGGHTAQVSKTWPPGHDFTISNDGGTYHHPDISAFHPPNVNWPPGHWDYYSQTWTNHNQELSLSWPPNHWKVITASWGPDHDAAISSTWPPNFHSQSQSANVSAHGQRQSQIIITPIDINPVITQE